jgi:hypothetical protein
MNIISYFTPHFRRKIQVYPETVTVIASEPAVEILKTYGNNIFYLWNALID